MTGGNLYQISNYNFNSKNNYLELDPQISFYKIVFRRYTRFALENITIDTLSRSKIDYSNTTNINGEISRYGDLLSELYFTFELPAIYSEVIQMKHIQKIMNLDGLKILELMYLILPILILII